MSYLRSLTVSLLTVGLVLSAVSIPMADTRPAPNKKAHPVTNKPEMTARVIPEPNGAAPAAQKPEFDPKEMDAGARPQPTIQRRHINPEEVVDIHLAMGKLSLIQLPEPPKGVICGDPSNFQITAVENKVLITPLVDNASSNLFVFTSVGRLNFNLSSRPHDKSLTYVIDYEMDERAKEAEAERKKLTELRKELLVQEQDKLMRAVIAAPFPLPPTKKRDTHPLVYFQTPIRIDNFTYVGYTLINPTQKPYSVKEPKLTMLTAKASHLKIPPYGLVLEEKDLRKYSLQSGPPLSVAEHRVLKTELPPGTQTRGVLAVSTPVESGSVGKVSVFFSPGDRGPVGGALLLE